MIPKLEIGNNYTDRGRLVFRMGLSPQRRAHSFEQFETVEQIEAGSFSTCGSRLGAAHIRFKHLQQFPGSRPVPFQNVALALPPRTLF